MFLIPEEDVPAVSPDTPIDSPDSIVTTPDSDSPDVPGRKKAPSTLTEKNLQKLDKSNQGVPTFEFHSRSSNILYLSIALSLSTNTRKQMKRSIHWRKVRS